MEQSWVLEGRKCVLSGSPDACDLLLQPSEPDAAFFAEETDLLAKLVPGRPFMIVSFEIRDWQRELTPWPAPPVFGKEAFGDGAGETLAFLQSALIPRLASLRRTPGRLMIGGYSLAGLFALWAASQCQAFDGAAGVSPSLWYPGWKEYTDAHPLQARHVYLSLGDKEEHTRNQVMARVGDALRTQYAAICAAGTDCVMEWNAGGHFNAPAYRTAKGFAWLMQRPHPISSCC